MPAVIEEAQSKTLQEVIKEINAIGTEPDYARYQNDPVAFGRDVLGHEYTEDVQEMMRSVVKNRITLGRSANGVGKSYAAADLAVWFYTVYSDAQVILTAASPERKIQLIFRYINKTRREHPELFEGAKVIHLLIEDKDNEHHFIQGVTIPITGTVAQQEAKFSGEHSGHQLFIFDEGDAISDPVYKAVESCMSGTDPHMLVLFNPRTEIGEVWRMEEEQIANIIHMSAFRHPNVITGEDRIPGAVSRETTVIRVNRWCRRLVEGEIPSDECFELPDFLIGAVAEKKKDVNYPPLLAGWYHVEDPQFDYMVLGRYPSQPVRQLISRESIARARANYDSYVAKHGETPPAMSSCILGLDVAEFGIDSNAACFRWGNWVPPLIYWNGVGTMITAKRAVREYREQNAHVAYVDDLGIGSGVPERMNELGCYTLGVRVSRSPTKKECEFGKFFDKRAELWWAVRDWLDPEKNANPMLPPDKQLLEDLRCPTYWPDKKGLIRVSDKDTMREKLKRSPNGGDALCLTMEKGETWADGCVFT